MSTRRPQQWSINIGAVDSIALPYDESRVAIIFSPPGEGVYFAMFGEEAVTSSGLTMFANVTPFVLTREMVGDIITQQLHVVAAGAIVAGMITISEA